MCVAIPAAASLLLLQTTSTTLHCRLQQMTSPVGVTATVLLQHLGSGMLAASAAAAAT
jgi:hypothetical protein